MNFRFIFWRVGITAGLLFVRFLAGAVPDARPEIANRTFNAVGIEELISKMQPLWKSKDLARLFSNCFPNSLDTTVAIHLGKEDTFVITGDIYAMWLRDSTNQMLPYIPYAAADERLSDMLQGLLARQSRSILIDSFANAFNPNASGSGNSDAHQSDIRKPPMQPAVFEGKYEIDSLCAFFKLSYYYYIFTENPNFAAPASGSPSDWIDAIEKAVDTIEVMRHTTTATDTLEMSGLGPAGLKDVGFSRSLFRPSDDAVTLPYNIPGNAMACVELKHVLRARQVHTKAELEEELVEEMSVYPYEVDGFGSRLYMDDANIPSLLSLPILGYASPSNPLYLKTRKTLLSESTNPFFFSGIAGSGIGGPHVGYQMAWPMSIAVRAMTSDDDAEVEQCVRSLVSVCSETGLMHESFNVNNSSDFTRPWFAWANGLFGEMLLQLVNTKPHLVLRDSPEIVRKAQALVRPTVSLVALLEAKEK
eukprot:GSChrysophyteH1.ASY1.ANO1.698.1 assembled CDS